MGGGETRCGGVGLQVGGEEHVVWSLDLVALQHCCTGLCTKGAC